MKDFNDHDDFGTITPERDEIAMHRNRGGSQTSRGPQTTQVAVKRSGSTFLTFLVICLTGAVAGGGYLGWKQVKLLQVALQDSNRALAEAQSQLGTLEGGISERAQAINALDTEVEKQIKFLDQEVRKLWDLSNKRNRKNIEKMEKDLASLMDALAKSNKSQATVVSQNKSLSKDIDHLKSELASIESAMKNQLEQIDAAKAALETSVNNKIKSLGSNQEQVQAAVDKANVAEHQVRQLEEKLTSMVEENQNAIRSIDAYRKRLNLTISDIRKSINRLEDKSLAKTQ